MANIFDFKSIFYGAAIKIFFIFVLFGSSAHASESCNYLFNNPPVIKNLRMSLKHLAKNGSLKSQYGLSFPWGCSASCITYVEQAIGLFLKKDSIADPVKHAQDRYFKLEEVRSRHVEELSMVDIVEELSEFTFLSGVDARINSKYLWTPVLNLLDFKPKNGKLFKKADRLSKAELISYSDEIKIVNVALFNLKSQKIIGAHSVLVESATSKGVRIIDPHLPSNIVEFNFDGVFTFGQGTSKSVTFGLVPTVPRSDSDWDLVIPLWVITIKLPSSSAGFKFNTDSMSMEVPSNPQRQQLDKHLANFYNSVLAGTITNGSDYHRNHPFDGLNIIRTREDDPRLLGMESSFYAINYVLEKRTGYFYLPYMWNLRPEHFIKTYTKPTSAPMIDDLIVYYDSSGKTVHLGVYKGVNPHGQIMVQSMFGGDPIVYLHPLDLVPTTFGDSVKFYRLEDTPAYRLHSDMPY